MYIPSRDCGPELNELVNFESFSTLKMTVLIARNVAQYSISKVIGLSKTSINYWKNG